MKHGYLFIILLSFNASVLAENKTAVFAGGCFWCMEPPFDKTEGVLSTISGYTGGHTENPTYRQTSTGTTGHYEALKIEYDPDIVSYQSLLDILWKNIDVFDAHGQFCDKGPQYRAAIFFGGDDEKQLAIESKQVLQSRLAEGQTIVTEILPAKTFYAAEDYHQDYYKKSPVKYQYYRFACGRDARLKEVHKVLKLN